MDYLAIGVHELASMSERRIERLVNPGRYKNNRVGISIRFDVKFIKIWY